jgi:hypothetical protein
MIYDITQNMQQTHLANYGGPTLWQKIKHETQEIIKPRDISKSC